jgi:alkaline phosphatase D
VFTTPPTLSRRTVIAAGFGLIAAACTSPSEPANQTEAVPSTTDGGPESTTAPTSTPETTTTTEPQLAAVEPPPFDGAFPFALGVASGDPDATSVLLWTRLIDAGLEDTQPIAVDIATDEAFTDLLHSSLQTTVAEHAHTLHHEVGDLPSDSWFWYRFRVGEHTSAAGRARTAPAADSDTNLRFAFSSCQNWESGAYGAHRLLAETDHDLFVWLGDYIYEYGPSDTPDVVTSAGLRVHDSPEVTDLDAYRKRYELYRSDPHLQAHHAARPWVVVWDDHEVDNNHAGPTSADEQADFDARRQAAYKAWWEHMPVRFAPPTGGDFQIHRTMQWGQLLNLHMLDGRQYRDPQPTDGEPVVLPGVADFGLRTMGPTALSPDQSMLGPGQEVWLQDQLATSSARWNALGNQVYMHGLNALPGSTPSTNTDTWDGYSGARRTLLEGALDSGVRNLVVLTGDFHSTSVGDVRTDPYDPSTPIVATELMAPAISSRFPEQLRSFAPIVLALNPQVRWFDPDNGWMSCEVTPETWTTDVMLLADVTNEMTTARSAATIVVNDGIAGAGEITERSA